MRARGIELHQMIEDGQTKVETQSKQLVEKDKEIDEQKEHAIVISSEIK
jgi:hypothetical protein